ncbi:MAG: PD-(D/E)XK nuclease family protein [Halobacteriales archaeon]
MAIPRGKSAEQLYAECRRYDLVLVPDPPLASALNRRLERAHFGPFATTPRRLAAGRRETSEDRLAFLQVIDETDMSWKEAAYAIGNVLQCWDNRGAPDAVLEYAPFATPEHRAVIEVMETLDTTSSRLAEYQIEADRSVAVVGLEEFTALERSILPAEYDVIDLFGAGSFDLPPFRLFDSPAAIVDTIVDSVTEDNADRVAVVLDRSGEFSPLVEAALEAAELPSYGGPGFNDEPDHRAFLRLLRTAHAGTGVRVADVRPILERLGADVDVAHDEKRLHALDRSEVDWLRAFCAEIDAHTFESAIEAFEADADVDLDAFREELGNLGLLNERITEAAVDDLQFYLDRYEVPVDRDNDGVLLADAKTAATVDRPAVFYLGMDEGWTHSSPRRPWVDRDAEFARNLQQFQRLLQNGVEQYYLVLDERGGRPVTPCLYFEELLDAAFEQFSDLESVNHARTYRAARDGFEREPTDVHAESVDSISQSSLNRLVNCPRDHLFNRLVDGPDRDYFVVGNLFHDFAEVYVNHPAAIDAAAIERVVDRMLESTRPFDREVDRATNRTRYRVGLETIVEFLDADPPVGAAFLTPDTGWGENEVATLLGLDIETPHTEWWFDDGDLGLRGKVDLVHSRTRFVDYKSGSRNSPTQVVRKAALDPPHDTPDFQALLYLTYHRSKVANEPLEFTFFHFLETLDDAVTGEAALDDCLTTVTYNPVPFEDYIAREAVFDELRGEGAKHCRRTLEQIDYGQYAEVLAEHPFPEGSSKAEVMDSALGVALHRRLIDAVGEYAYVENGCAQALAYLAGIRDANFFADDLDAFEGFVADRLEELNGYRAGEKRFPVEGLGGEPNWRRVDNRDMILEGDV